MPVLLLIFHFMHPFHVSVCDIKYSKPQESLQITHRIFIDDLENAIRNENGIFLDIIKSEEENKKSLEEYVQKYIGHRFLISINGKDMQPVYLGMELEGDVVWIYWETSEIIAPKNLKIFNSILLEQFDDQINLTHVDINGTIKTVKTDQRKNTGKVSF